MDILKIAAVGTVGALLAVMLKSYKKELSMATAVTTGLVITAMMLADMYEVFASFSALIDKTGIDGEYFTIILKVTGIAYIAQFASELCRDAGEAAVAVKVEAAAKLAVLLLTMPVLRDFLDNVLTILQ